MKKKLYSKIVTALLSVTMACSLAGCGSSGTASSGASSSGPASDSAPASSAASSGAADSAATLRVAILNTAPPMEYEKDGKLTGFEVDLLNDIAKEMNVTVNYTFMTFDGMIPALQADQVDIAAAGFFVTDARKKVIDFSDSYYEDGNALAVKSTSKIGSFDDLKDKTIVAKKGAASATAAQTLVEKYGAKLELFADESSMFMELDNGGADAVVEDSSVLSYKTNIDGSDYRIIGMIDKNPVALALQKDSSLTGKINQAIQKLKKSGEFDKLYNKYLAS